MPRTNRVDPWGDLHAAAPRGLLTGNRGCLVDDDGTLVRHHGGSLWIACLTRFKDWSHPLAAPRVWTPLFFLDDAVALAAGHRPCARCRRADHLAYRDAVTSAIGAVDPVSAADLNRRLAVERLQRGRGLVRADDRILWEADSDELPPGTVVVDPAEGSTHLLGAAGLQRFAFDGWEAATARPSGVVLVLTPPTSVAALAHGFAPLLHPSAA